MSLFTPFACYFAFQSLSEGIVNDVPSILQIV